MSAHTDHTDREYRLGPWLVLAAWSRDASDPLWGHTEAGGQLVVRHVVSVHYVRVPDGRRVWCANVGRLKLSWGRDPERCPL